MALEMKPELVKRGYRMNVTSRNRKFNRRAFLSASAVISTAVIAIPVVASKSDDPHVAWLEQWRSAREKELLLIEEMGSETPASEVMGDIAEDLSLKLANTQATTFEGLRAQYHWFMEDLGELYIREGAGSNHSGCIDLITRTFDALAGEMTV